MANETATENLTYRMSVDGQAQVIAAFEASAKAMASAAKALEGAAGSAKKIPPALKPATQAANDNARAFSGMAQNTQRVLPAFSALGASVSRLNPELGQMYSAIGRASGAIGGMTAALGGVAGLAAGGLVMAVGLLADEFSRADKEAKEFEKTQQENIKAARDAKEALDAQRQSLRETANQWAMGLGFSSRAQGLMAQLESAKAKRALLGDAEKNIGGGVVLVNEARVAADKEIERLQKEVDKAKNEKPDWAQSTATVERARGGFGYRSQEDIQAQIRRLDAMAQAPTLDERAEAGKGAIQAQRDAAEAQQRDFEERARERAKILDTEQRRYGEIRKVGMEAYQAIGATAATALSSIARGQKVTLKEVMGAIGGELVGKGVMWGFEGGAKLASSYGTDPAGWELLAIGAAAVAAGMGMGAAASSGSQQQRGGPTRQRPIASDPAYQVDTMGGRSQAPITVNYYSTFAPSAQDGQRAAQAIEEARRQGLVAA